MNDLVLELLTLIQGDDKSTNAYDQRQQKQCCVNGQVTSAQAQRPSKEQIISTLQVGRISIGGQDVGRG